MNLITISACAVLGFTSGARAAERPGKAVFETSAESGMKLRPKALANIDVTLGPVRAKPTSLPTTALVHTQDHVGVYRVRDGWYKLIPVRVSRRGGGDVVIEAEGLAVGDQVALTGAGLLRVAELDAFTGAEE